MATEKKEKLTYDQHMKMIESNGNHIKEVPASMVDQKMVTAARKNYARVHEIPVKFQTFPMFVNDAPSYSQKEAKEFAETHAIDSRFGISMSAFAKLVVKNELPNMKRVPEKLANQVQLACYRKVFNSKPEIVELMPKNILDALMSKNQNFIRRVYNDAKRRSRSSYGSDTWIGYKLLKLFKEDDFNNETIEYIQENLLERLKSDNRHYDKPGLTEIPEFLKTYEIYLAWVSNSGTRLSYVPEHCRDIDMCKAAVNADGDALKHVPEDLKKEFYLDSVKKGGLGSIPEEDRTDRLCTLAVETDPSQIEDVPVEKRSYALCLNAIDNDPELFPHIPEETRDEEMVIRFLISVFSKNFKNDFVLNRDWQKDGSTPIMQMAFDSVITSTYSSDIRKEKEALITKAIERCPEAFGNYVELTRDDRWSTLSRTLTLDICLTAFKGKDSNISYIPQEYLIRVFNGYIQNQED